MNLNHGTYEDYMGTAKENNFNSVWSGDLKQNSYLAENILFLQDSGLLTIKLVEDFEGQSNIYIITWLQ